MVKCLRNYEQNGIEIYFDRMPSVSVRDELKTNRWRWNSKKECWYKYYTDANYKFATRMCNSLNKRSGASGKTYTGYAPIEEWNQESIYREFGYTVGREMDLTDQDRWNILEKVVELKLRSVSAVCYYLETMIALHENNTSYMLARGRWEKDLKHMRNYCA